MTERELPILEPPPGGLAMLRERLDAEEHRGVRVRRFAIPALVVAAAAAIALWLATGRAPHVQAEPSVATNLVPDSRIGGDVAFYWVSPSQVAPSQPVAPAFVDISAVSITP